MLMNHSMPCLCVATFGQFLVQHVCMRSKEGSVHLLVFVDARPISMKPLSSRFAVLVTFWLVLEARLWLVLVTQ